MHYFGTTRRIQLITAYWFLIQGYFLDPAQYRMAGMLLFMRYWERLDRTLYQKQMFCASVYSSIYASFIILNFARSVLPMS